MFGLGLFEVATILVVALVVLGPANLPRVARQLARLLGDVRRVADEVRRDFDDSLADEGRPPPPPPPPPPEARPLSPPPAAPPDETAPP